MRAVDRPLTQPRRDGIPHRRRPFNTSSRLFFGILAAHTSRTALPCPLRKSYATLLAPPLTR